MRGGILRLGLGLFMGGAAGLIVGGLGASEMLQSGSHDIKFPKDDFYLPAFTKKDYIKAFYLELESRKNKKSFSL